MSAGRKKKKEMFRNATEGVISSTACEKTKLEDGEHDSEKRDKRLSGGYVPERKDKRLSGGYAPERKDKRGSGEYDNSEKKEKRFSGGYSSSSDSDSGMLCTWLWSTSGARSRPMHSLKAV